MQPASKEHRMRKIMQPRPCGCAPRGPHRRDCVQVPVTKREPAFEPTAVPPPPVRRLQPKPAALAARASIIAARVSMKPGRPPELRDMDDNANAGERWTSDQIDEERELAEGRKHEGELPRPSSSFRVDRGEVAELNFEAD
jgi:hypothetical protein